MKARYNNRNIKAFAKEKQEEKQKYINHLKDTIKELNNILNEYEEIDFNKMFNYCMKYDYRPPVTDYHEIPNEIYFYITEKTQK